MIGHILQKVVERIYSMLRKSRLAYLYFPKEVRNDIQLLGKDERKYYIQKLQYTCGLLLVCTVIAVVYIMSLLLDSSRKITALKRPEVYQENQEVVLQVGDSEEVYSLEIAPVALSVEEAEKMFEKAVVLLKGSILGNNVSLDAVTENLVLEEYLEGYPFDIYWESDREDIVDTLGTVNREGITEDTIVILTAEFCYEDWVWREQFGILVLKEQLSEEERYRRDLGNFLIKEEAADREEDVWTLPGEFEGEELQYHVIEKDYTLLWLALLTAVTGIVIWLSQDYDLRAERRKRQEVFRTEYASLVNSLSLYISAGMTLQKAMLLCVRDYERRKPPEHLLRVALGEFRKDMENGYGFAAAIGRFSELCDDANYKKMAGLLTQGVMNGAQGLSVLLEKEAEQVNEEKRRQVKVKGEQVSTALIAPMMLQLGIVIALIMLPAFNGLQF